MKNQKLSEILKPKYFNDLVCFSDVHNNFKQAIQNKFLFSFILYGEPGIGKTSLANCLAKEFSDHQKIVLNGSQNIKADLNNLVDKIDTKDNFIVIIDEIHSLNKNVQDLLLSILESHNIFVFATTTVNPYVHINPAIRSRMHILELKKNKQVILEDLYQKLLKVDLKNSYSVSDLELLLNYTQYDIRHTINLLDLIDHLFATEQINEQLIQKLGMLEHFNSGKFTNEFHDLKSAFQKSIRGSDVNASLFYLGHLIKFQDLNTIVRRLKIIAYEDIGLANPNLCMRTTIACDAALSVGLPEAKYILANLVLELALSPKSNSAAQAISNVLKYIDDNPILDIPNHIRDNNYVGSSNVTKNAYLYPHDFENHFVEQQYLPENIKEIFYNYDCSNAYEDKMNNAFKIWTKRKK